MQLETDGLTFVSFKTVSATFEPMRTHILGLTRGQMPL